GVEAGPGHCLVGEQLATVVVDHRTEPYALALLHGSRGGLDIDRCNLRRCRAAVDDHRCITGQVTLARHDHGLALPHRRDTTTRVDDRHLWRHAAPGDALVLDRLVR